MTLKESNSSLENSLAQLKEKAKTKIADLQKKLEERNSGEVYSLSNLLPERFS